MPEPEAALRKLHRMLIPGGILLLPCPGKTTFQETGPDGK